MSYRVSFFKALLSSDGHQFRCLQQSIVIRRARNVERAVEAAKRRFERRCRVTDWRLYADGVELVRAHSTSTAMSAAAGVAGQRGREQVNCGRESRNEL